MNTGFVKFTFRSRLVPSNLTTFHSKDSISGSIPSGSSNGTSSRLMTELSIQDRSVEFLSMPSLKVMLIAPKLLTATTWAVTFGF